MKHTVHMYAVVRVATEVEAGSHAEAIDEAVRTVGPKLDGLFNDPNPMDPRIKSVEFSDDIEGFLVDEEGDPEHLKTQFYTKDGVVPGENCCHVCNSPVSA